MTERALVDARLAAVPELGFAVPMFHDFAQRGPGRLRRRVSGLAGLAVVTYPFRD